MRPPSAIAGTHRLRASRCEGVWGDSIYRLDLVFPHRGTGLELRFFGYLADEAEGESWGLAGVQVEVIDGGDVLGEEELTELWTILCGEDPVAANAALWKILAAGEREWRSIERRWRAFEDERSERTRAASEAARLRVREVVGQLGDSRFAAR